MCERVRSWLSPSGTSLLRPLSRRRDFSSTEQGTGLGAGLTSCRSPEFGLAGERPPFILSARQSPMEEGDERLRSVLPGRQGRRSLCRALDAACAARIIVRQHAFQRSSPRRAADVAKLAQPAIKAARTDWGGRAQARAARPAISPHPGGAGIRADRPPVGGMGPALVPLPVRAR